MCFLLGSSLLSFLLFCGRCVPQAAENQGIGKVASAGLFGGGSYGAMLLGWWVGRSCFLLVPLLWVAPEGGKRGTGSPTVAFGAGPSSECCLAGENSIPRAVLPHARAGMARFTCLNPSPNFQALPAFGDPMGAERGLQMCVCTAMNFTASFYLFTECYIPGR